MKRLLAILLVAAMARPTARAAIELRTELTARAGRAGQAVYLMTEPPVCQCCKKERVDKGYAPRPLLLFKLDGFTKPATLNICETCDGEELVLSITKNSE